jgi:trehalose 6-phosphate phosphatase
VLELRPVTEVHKGTAARAVIAESGISAALFGGDDTTDLDAFTALRELAAEGELEHAVCVAVASEEAPGELQRRADVVVDGPEGFLDLLRGL